MNASDGAHGLTVDRLKELFRYDPDTGNFIRVQAAGIRAPVGAVAGCLKKDSGYVIVTVDYRQYRAHRLAWLYMTGEWPSDEVDHEDTIRHNNRWSNLRIATPQLNQQNLRAAQSNSKTGLLGASWCARRKKFVARIMVKKKHTIVGYFDTPQQAHEAYLAAKRQHHPGNTL